MYQAFLDPRYKQLGACTSQSDPWSSCQRAGHRVRNDRVRTNSALHLPPRHPRPELAELRQDWAHTQSYRDTRCHQPRAGFPCEWTYGRANRRVVPKHSEPDRHVQLRVPIGGQHRGWGNPGHEAPLSRACWWRYRTSRNEDIQWPIVRRGLPGLFERRPAQRWL